MGFFSTIFAAGVEGAISSISVANTKARLTLHGSGNVPSDRVAGASNKNAMRNRTREGGSEPSSVLFGAVY